MGAHCSHAKTFCLGTHLNNKNSLSKTSPVDGKITGDVSSESILVIDSGIGGLSVCQSILAQQPRLQIIYFADSAHFPYGLMPEARLSDRLKVIVEKMLEIHQPKLVVLACNTVSTLLLPELRTLFDIPFVGVVPAIKPAAIMSNTKRIGLLATPATVLRPYTDQLIEDYASFCEVVKVGSSELVVQAENLLNDDAVDQAVIDLVLKPFRSVPELSDVDTIVLGCTHFPLLKTQLQASLPNVNWVDSGEAIANRVSFLLQESYVDKDINTTKLHQLYFSTTTRHKHEFSNIVRRLGFKAFDLHYLEHI